jgi:hypothetical protein
MAGEVDQPLAAPPLSELSTSRVSGSHNHPKGVAVADGFIERDAQEKLEVSIEVSPPIKH